jgi:hypothetical protein
MQHNATRRSSGHLVHVDFFSFSLKDEARRWYTLASIEAKGNWDELVKKFLLKLFPISKVQDLRRQVLNFKQGEDEEIDEAWDYFNELLEQGPNLGFSDDLMLHKFSTKHIHKAYASLRMSN